MFSLKKPCVYGSSGRRLIFNWGLSKDPECRRAYSTEGFSLFRSLNRCHLTSTFAISLRLSLPFILVARFFMITKRLPQQENVDCFLPFYQFQTSASTFDFQCNYFTFVSFLCCVLSWRWSTIDRKISIDIKVYFTSVKWSFLCYVLASSI